MSFLFKRMATPVLKNTGSCARDHLASERTFLAWIRTGLGFIALGIAVERFSQLDLESLVNELKRIDSSSAASSSSSSSSSLLPLSTSSSSAKDNSDKDEGDDDNRTAREKEQALVGALLGTGSGSIIYGTSRYFSNLRLIERGEFKPAFHGAAVLSVVVAGMAGAAYWNTMRHGMKMRKERDEEKKEEEEEAMRLKGKKGEVRAMWGKHERR